MTDIEARREARRRKILQNSEKRLQKITGVQKKTGINDLDGFNCSQSYDDNWINNTDSTTNEFHSSEALTSNIESTEPRQISSVNSGIYAPISKKLPFFIINNRLAVIISTAFLVNICLCISEMHPIVNKIFIPLLCFEAISLFYNQSKDISPFERYIILLKGNLRGSFSKHLPLIFKYLGIMKTLFNDLLIYFFVFSSLLYFRKLLIDDSVYNCL